MHILQNFSPSHLNLEVSSLEKLLDFVGRACES